MLAVGLATKPISPLAVPGERTQRVKAVIKRRFVHVKVKSIMLIRSTIRPAAIHTGLELRMEVLASSSSEGECKVRCEPNVAS